MAILWIILSTKWELSSVQASLNVIISVLSTIGLWSFTRYWWRRGSVRVIRDKTSVPLSNLLTISGIGDGWDVMMVLQRQIFAKENWHLLIQLIVVGGVTLACALAGPIAKVSLKNGFTILPRTLQVQLATKGGGWFGNQLDANVLWNTTSQSLTDAKFPDNQLLEFLPPSTTPPWVYVASEWQPAWNVACNYTEDVALQNVSGNGSASCMDPVNAFPAFQQTYDPKWLTEPQYRVTANFLAWYNWSQAVQFSDALFFVLAQSNPEYQDQMYNNNDTLYISLSVLHARNFRVLVNDGNAVAGEDTWMPIGPVGEASYSRAECAISKTAKVAPPDEVPWPWTNDTASIVYSYRTYHHTAFSALASKHLPAVPPTARDLFKFYQVYMAAITTRQSEPSPMSISMEVETVDLSVLFLAALVVLTVLTGYSGLRYGMFLQHYSGKIKELYVPDSRIEWMIHAAKTSEDVDLERDGDRDQRKERDYLKSATFGHAPSDLSSQASDLQIPKLARVMSFGSPGPSPMLSIPRAPSSRLSSLAEDLHPGPGSDISRLPSPASSYRRSSTGGSRDCSPHPAVERSRSLSVADAGNRFLSVAKRGCPDLRVPPSKIIVQPPDAGAENLKPNPEVQVEVEGKGDTIGKPTSA